MFISHATGGVVLVEVMLHIGSVYYISPKAYEVP